MGNFFYILLTIIFGFLGAIYLSFKNSYRFWNKRNIPFIEPQFPFGNFRESIKNLHFAYISQKLYEKLKIKNDIGCGGIWMFKKPAILVTNPEFAKIILVRDFNIFMDRGIYYNPKDDPLSSNLFFNEGLEWKILRQKLSPAFTSNKMKIMFITLLEVNKELQKTIEDTLNEDIDIKELMACYTTDVVSSCIFGLDGDCLKLKSNSEFRQIGKKLMKFTKKHQLLQFIGMTFRNQARALGLKLFDKDITDFFSHMVHKTIGFRKENNIHRNDLMQIMIELMRQDYESTDGLTIDEVAANAFIFFLGGFENTSTTLTFALYNLAKNQQIQNNLRKEIQTILNKYDGKIIYDSLIEFDLLERVILETLRLYPPVASLHRISNRSYTLPNGSEIPTGTNVIIPVYGLHHDSTIYPEPEIFNPERFTNEAKSKRHPYSFLPFGEGQRICIGQRFAIMQVQTALISILKNYKIDLCSKCDIPPKIDHSRLTFQSCDGSVLLKFNKI